MSEHDYWHGNAESFWAYRAAYELKNEESMDIENFKAWLYGLYNFNALSVSNYNINRKESDPVENYFERPIEWREERQRQKEEEDRKERQQALELNMQILLSKHQQKLRKEKKGKS